MLHNPILTVDRRKRTSSTLREVWKVKDSDCVVDGF